MRAQSAASLGVDLPMTMSASITRPEPAAATGVAPRRSVPLPAIAGVGTATAGEPYSQRDLLDIFRITDPRVRSVFLNSAIERRYLSLPAAGDDGTPAHETQGELLAKHKTLALDMGRARSTRP
jgi:polyketide synthase Type III